MLFGDLWFDDPNALRSQTKFAKEQTAPTETGKDQSP